MLSFGLRQGARQAQKAAQGRIVIAWPPNRAELKYGITAGNGTENNFRKGRNDGRLACQGHPPAHRDEMHYRLAAHLRLLNAWRARAIGKVLDHAFTKRRAAIRFTNDEMFVAKSLPFDRLPATKRMVLREHDKQTLAPKRRGVAIGRLACIRHKCHIKAAFPNQRNVPH